VFQVSWHPTFWLTFVLATLLRARCQPVGCTGTRYTKHLGLNCRDVAEYHDCWQPVKHYYHFVAPAVLINERFRQFQYILILS